MRNAKGMAWAIAGTGLLALIFTASVLAKKGGLPPGQAKKKGYHHVPARGKGKPHHAPASSKVRPAHKGGPPPWAPAHGYRSKYRYRYYPGHQVYFDSVRAHYFWFSAGTWLSGPALPPAIVLPPTGFVTLGMDVPDPFKFHREVIMRFPIPR